MSAEIAVQTLLILFCVCVWYGKYRIKIKEEREKREENVINRIKHYENMQRIQYVTTLQTLTNFQRGQALLDGLGDMPDVWNHYCGSWWVHC